MFKNAAKTVLLKSKVMNKAATSGPIYCRIHLDGKNVGIYSPGNEILGHVTVNYNEEFSYCGLKLVLEGTVHVKYRDDKGAHERHDSVITESIYLVGSYGQHKIKSKPGTEATHAFSFQLPVTDLPGTFRSEYGHVSYHIFLFVDYGDNKLVRKSSKHLTIQPQLDLDSEDTCANVGATIEQADAKAVKRIGYNKISTQHQLRFVFRIETSIFRYGEEIPFDLEIYNPNNEYKIMGIKVDFLQKIIYHASKVPKEVKTVLATLVPPKKVNPYAIDEPEDFNDGQPRSRSNSKRFGTEVLDMGSLALNNCDRDNYWEGRITSPRGLVPTFKGGLIEFEYFLRVVVKTNKACLSGYCPITITTTRDGLSIEQEENASEFYNESNPKLKKDQSEDIDLDD